MRHARNQLCTCLIVLCLAMEAPVSAHRRPAPESSSAPSRRAARKLDVPGVPLFMEVTPNLYRGGQPTKDGFQSLARMGIGIVVDVRGSRKHERHLVTAAGMRYVPMPWHCQFPKDKVFARFLLLLRRNPEKKVFLHCRLGDDRAGMMVAAYRMVEQGWSAQQAWQEMKTSGF